MLSIFFFFNDTATTEIYTLSLHDALPIFESERDGTGLQIAFDDFVDDAQSQSLRRLHRFARSEEHTSELQSRRDLVCRLLLEKKKKKKNTIQVPYNVTIVHVST